MQTQAKRKFVKVGAFIRYKLIDNVKTDIKLYNNRKEALEDFTPSQYSEIVHHINGNVRSNEYKHTYNGKTYTRTQRVKSVKGWLFERIKND